MNQQLFTFDADLGDDVNTPPPYNLSFGLRWQGPLFIDGAIRMVAKRRVHSVAYSTWDENNDPEVYVVDVSYTATDIAMDSLVAHGCGCKLPISLTIATSKGYL